MSVNVAPGKGKIRPGRKSLRSESGSENMLRRSASGRDDTLDYEISPSPSIALMHANTHLGTHGTSSESVRHIGLNLGDDNLEELETPPATPLSARTHSKSASTRELPKNWSDDESASVTEVESVKSADESHPLPHSRLHSKSNSPMPDTNTSSKQLSSQPPTKAERKRSSASARVSPRADKKAGSIYTTIVSREKLDRSSRDMLCWVQMVLAPFKSVSVDSWDHFKDGVALIHLIHCCDATIVDLEQFDMSDPIRTLEAAFDLADTRLGIPNVLDAKSLMEARLGERGPDLRTFILYVSHFKTAHTERQIKENPLNSARTVLADIKQLVNRKFAQVETLGNVFQDECDRLVALSTQNELEEERKYLQQRSFIMDKMMEMSRQLNSELEAQNLALRDQTRLLSDKISHLTRALEQEKQEKEIALAHMDMSERIKAMAELLAEPDLDKFIDLHKEEIDRLTSELTEAQQTPQQPPKSARQAESSNAH